MGCLQKNGPNDGLIYCAFLKTFTTILLVPNAIKRKIKN